MAFSLLSLLWLAPSGLTVDEFKTLHAQLQPAKGEAWRTIPWKVSLVEAQAAAARARNRYSSGRWTVTRWAARETTACSTVRRPSLIPGSSTYCKLDSCRWPSTSFTSANRKMPRAISTARSQLKGRGRMSKERLKASTLRRPTASCWGSTTIADQSGSNGCSRRSLKDFQPVAVPSIKPGAADPRFALSPPQGGLVVRVTAKVLGGYEETDDEWQQDFSVGSVP